MRNPDFYSAVFLIIQDISWKLLFQKRSNSWFRDGQYQLPSWHVEWRERIQSAIIREANEELWIIINESAIQIVHVAHTLAWDRVYFNIYARIEKYAWNIRNCEPHKCSEISFYEFSEIQHHPDFLYEVETLEKIFWWNFFSEKIVL
jgi:8-oxo-dGTP diphosphatase